jgi:putative membrane protein
MTEPNGPPAVNVRPLPADRTRRIVALGGAEMMWWPGGGAGMIGWLVFAVIGAAMLVLLVVVALGRSNRAPDRRHGDRPAPTEVLDDRLARGEIDVAEYRERRTALGEERPA